MSDSIHVRFLPMKYWKEALLSLGLVLGITCVYGQVAGFEFVTIDDPTYITRNYIISQGLTLNGIKWALTTFYMANWHPLTWISHMLDFELYGMRPGMHHVTNVILHTASGVMLFFLLRLSTGSVWKSVVVAALFALHPLHVESVAWIAERKDVLSAMFWMLTMIGYLWYVRNPSLKRYLLVVGAFALGLMSKPMLVTLPFVLLLFDYWPLKRTSLVVPSPTCSSPASPGGWKIKCVGTLPLILEKIPLFILTVVSSIVTFIAQSKGGAVTALQITPLDLRVLNATTSYVEYLWKMVWPFGLTVFYPLPESIDTVKASSALGLILILSLASFLTMEKRPYIFTGWLWYLGTLVPVIGFVQVGAQSMADRYTYIPLIGVFIALVWGLSDLSDKMPSGKVILGTIAMAALLAFASLSWVQVGTWKDGVTLFTHAVSVTRKNFLSCNNLGCALYERGDLKGAVKSFTDALRAQPNYAPAHANLGLTYEKEGNSRAAIAHYLMAMNLESSSASSHYVIAQGLLSFGYVSEAIQEYRKVLRLNPDHLAAWNELGQELVLQGEVEQGAGCFLRALRINPDDEYAKLHLGQILIKERRSAEPLYR